LGGSCLRGKGRDPVQSGMDPAALFGNANVHYVNEEYEEALKNYTMAVTLEDCVVYRACRAACYLKLGRFEETLQDAAEALAKDPKSSMASYWKGIALFYMGDFAAAKASFEASQQAQTAVWLRKCNAELSGSTLPLIGVTAEVSKASKPAATQSAPPAEAQRAPAAAPAKAPAPTPAPTPAPAPAPAAVPANASGNAEDAAATLSISGRRPVKREWYQSNTHVFITLFAKGVQEESCRVDFQEKEVSVVFPLPGSSNEEYQLNLDLYDSVDPAGCKVEVTKVKVEVTLQKKNASIQWKDLERKDEVAVQEIPPDQPAYPTSNKAKRDWSQIDREIEAELKNEKPDGDQALNKLFQQIYERADPDTRRAMNKSFQTSGGTVLSTNWGEVASNDYEGKDRPTPPDGQEWRDWRKK